ncbi:MAG: hypothetical protein NZT92_04875 [Abditibacteriales bacterium]|nr:hypothetical protein [Abditibacteriales bacterium]MDW8365263.1 hypothetical protein [Abditibacteriales bacterium]
MRQQRSRRFWQQWVYVAVSVWCSAWGAVAQEVSPLQIVIRTEEPTNLYYDADTVAIQSAVIVYVTIENQSPVEFRGSYDYEVVDYWGARVAEAKRSVGLNLSQGERVVRKELLDIARRGAFTFVARVKSGKEEIKRWHAFAIIPKPKGEQRPDSFFRVQAQADDAMTMTFLQRLGVPVRAVQTPGGAGVPVSPFGLRASGWQRRVDRQVQAAKRAGRTVTVQIGEIADSIEDRRVAPNMVAQHVMAALAGAYRVEMRSGTIAPRQLRESAAYATMVSLLEGRVPVRDLFPSAPNLWGALFASPALVNVEADVPRKDALSTRWKTAGDPQDVTKVAVVWSFVGADARHLDKGTMVIEDGEGIDALDLFGNPLGERRKKQLRVPLSAVPIYLISKLPIQTFAERVSAAQLEDLTPIALQLLPLTEPPDRAAKLVVRVQNQLNRPVTGTLSLNLPIGWSVQQTKYPFALEVGEMKHIPFDLLGAIAHRDNVYAVSVTAEVDRKKHERAQIVQVAAAVHGSVVIDGDLSDWADAYPLQLDYEQLTHPDAYARALFNPRSQRPAPTGIKRQVSARVYTKWDEQYFYFAAEVVEPELRQDAALAPNTGRKDFWNGDAVQLVFSRRERAADDYHAAGDPWRWKGAFRDSEFGFAAMAAQEGWAVVRLFAPGAPFRAAAVATTGYAKVKGAKVVVRREEAEDKTFYEVAIPLAEVGGLKPAEGIRFGFVLHNNEGVRGGRLQWGEAIGTWDDLHNVGALVPLNEPFLPCPTVWGFLAPSLPLTARQEK